VRVRYIPAPFLVIAVGCGHGPSSDWPQYGRDGHHTFRAASSQIRKSNVASLVKRWEFDVSDAVSASPTVVNGVVYVGAWDGFFYALDGKTGAVKWKFQVDCHNAIVPIPPQCLAPGQTEPNRTGTDGGLIVSSALVAGGKVYFGGGRTVYCLNAADGSLVWKKLICGNPDDPNCAADTNDGTLIFSSPLLVGTTLLLGHDVNGANGYRGGIVGLDAASGAIVWSFEVDPILDANGNPILGPNGLPAHGLNRGCGSVWSSGVVDDIHSVVYFSTADCQGANTPPYHESVLALEVATGKLQWVFRIPGTNACDFDLGTGLNIIDLPSGRFVGVGGKNGTYFLIEAQSGQLQWSTNVVFGGSAGGFIGPLAFDGYRIYGATAIGDFPPPVCVPSDPRDQQFQDPSFHAFDATSGAVVWENSNAYSFGPSSTTGGVVFNGVGNVISPELRAYDADTGATLFHFPTSGAVNTGVSIGSDAIYFGAGNSNDGKGGAVFCLGLP
jgi:polyvinyl alcohol dehydrogenase (cytochrome)